MYTLVKLVGGGYVINRGLCHSSGLTSPPNPLNPPNCWKVQQSGDFPTTLGGGGAGGWVHYKYFILKKKIGFILQYKIFIMLVL